MMKRLVYPLIMFSGTALAVERPDYASALEQDQRVSTSAPRQYEQESPLPVEPSATKPHSSEETPSAPPVQKVAWLGVAGDPVCEELSYHLNLDAGLITKIVSPTGPAHRSGLRPNDIIERVNDQNVYAQEDLRTILSQYQPEDTIELGVIARGERKVLPVTLSRRPDPSPQTGPPSQSSKEKDLFKDLLEMASPSKEGPERKRRSFGQILDGMGISRMLKDASPTKNFNLNFQSQRAITMMDEKGRIEIQSADEGTHITVMDTNGTVQYEGPWNTEEERSLAPPEIQERINNLSFKHESLKLPLLPRETR